LFGAFISQKDAEALSQRITAQGYDVWVVRGGPAYMLQLGPYPQSSVEAITGILKSGAADATVTVDPAP
ncbi:MAG TPA: SPOR domain-containing protein, partial [bacterium]|nr:SPOR domain-containing protein [bacterium]